MGWLREGLRGRILPFSDSETSGFYSVIQDKGGDGRERMLRATRNAACRCQTTGAILLSIPAYKRDGSAIIP